MFKKYDQTLYQLIDLLQSYLLIAKVFDVIDHDLFLFSLDKSGIRNPPHKMIGTYWSGRIQIVRVKQ